MDWSTIFTLGMFGWDRIQKNREEAAAAEAAAALPPPLVFTDPQVASFTSACGVHRAFDPDVENDILTQLSSRSAVPLSDPMLSQHGRAWLVVPLVEGQRVALDVVLEAWGASATVLGSHSLVLLGNGHPAPMVLLVGPPASRILALGAAPDRHGGVFAILERPEVAQAASEPPPAQAPVAHADVPFAPPDVPFAPPVEVAPVQPFPPAPAPASEESERLAADVAPKANRRDRARPNGIKKDEPTAAAPEAPAAEE